MDTKTKINELEKKIDNNMNKIIENMNRLHSHEEKINKNSEQIGHNTGALELLHAIKSNGDKYFIMSILFFLAFTISVIYNIRLTREINNIETITTEEIEQETDDGSNYYIGRDGDING